MNPAPRAYLLLLLHAHLPWVYEPGYAKFLEEYWFFEAMNETYLPLLVMLRRLRERGVPYRLALSFSPTLIAMMEHDGLLARFREFHRSLRDLAAREDRQWAQEPRLSRITSLYRWLFEERAAALESCGGRILRGFRELAEQGYLELLTTAAAHPFLTNLQDFPLLTRQLISRGLAVLRGCTGMEPRGFWLPESAYYPGLEYALADCGVRYFQVETHGLLHASPRPLFATAAPVYVPNGLAVFGRSPATGHAVWSSSEGYPGDPVYREFYRDVGWDADGEYVRPVLPPDGNRVSTGLKYYAITDRRRPLDERALYQPELALERACEHARHFVGMLEREAEDLVPRMPVAPVFFSPYDAELFGHWWFEGIAFLGEVLTILGSHPVLASETPAGYLQHYPAHQLAVPNMSTWGDRGFSQVWVNQFTEWVYPHQLAAAERYERMLREGWHFSEEVWRWLRTELFLAVASDFPFMITSGNYGEYSARRLREHLSLFNRLADDASAGRDLSWYEQYWCKRPQIL